MLVILKERKFCFFLNRFFLRDMLARYKHEIGKSQVFVSEFYPEYARWSSGTGKAGSQVSWITKKECVNLRKIDYSKSIKGLFEIGVCSSIYQNKLIQEAREGKATTDEKGYGN